MHNLGSLARLAVSASQGRAILSNKMARTVAFFYTLFLHCLVFLVGLHWFPPEDFLLLFSQQRWLKNRCGLLFPADFSCRCCTRRRGARASAGTAPLSALKSEQLLLTRGWTSKKLFFHLVCELISLPISLRYADHLHRFHEHDENLWARQQSASHCMYFLNPVYLKRSQWSLATPFICLQEGISPLGGSLRP